MVFRVTPQGQTLQIISQLQRNATRADTLQTHLSTGIRLQRPSEDPADASLVLASKAEGTRLDTHLNNIRDAEFVLRNGEATMLEVREILTEASQIAIEANNAANDLSTDFVRVTAADRLLERLVSTVNHRLSDGRHVFSGTATDKVPFNAIRDGDGRIVRVEYQGSQENVRTLIARGETVETFYAGDSVFQVRERGATEFTPDTSVDSPHATGAAPGTGTDSATGLGRLTVRHTTTTYGAGGVAPGTSSPGGDTVLGANTLTITAGTVSLNGGTAIGFTGTETDLRVTGPDGRHVFIDTTGANPNAGVVNFTADGELSTDDGLTFTAIDFTSDNQVVTDSRTGGVTHVDSRNISSVGEDSIDYDGTYDVFESLIALRDDLSQPAGPRRSDFLTNRLADIERSMLGMLDQLGDLGADSENLQALRLRTEDLNFELTRLASDIESADIAETIANLQAQDNLFQAGLLTAARVGQLSLVDFLR